MKLIDAITDYPFQQMTVIGENRERISLTLQYMAFQQLWRMDVSYDETTIKGILCVQSENILRQWKEILPFGIMIRSKDSLDPLFLNDFSSGRISLFLLNDNEASQIEDAL